MNVKTIAVIGAGEMGHGIAEVFAISGYSVHLVDIDPKMLKLAIQKITESLEKFVKKHTITQEQQAQILGRISTFTDLADAVKDVEMVIEAVPEIVELKAKIFQQLDQFAPKNAILGSNTSNIRITDIAKNVTNAERVLGVHFFNPPILMKLVELIKGEKTSDQILDTVSTLIKKLGKTPVKVYKDTPGFIVNRINAPEMLYFCLLLEHKIATPEEVDAFARLQGLPMGPYELIDYVGVDVVYNSLKYYAQKLSPDYAKCHIFETMVSNKQLGKKAGKGFYDWSLGRPKIDTSKRTDKVSLMDIFAIEINEAIKLIEEGVATPHEIETAVKLGLNRPFGPISVAKGLTNAEVKAKLEQLAKQFNTTVFEPAEAIKAAKMRDAIEGRLVQKKEQPQKTVPQQKIAVTKEEYKTLIVEQIDDTLVRVLLNRPKYNTINEDLLNDLEHLIDKLWNDLTVRVILISGEGSTFSAGAELSSFFANAQQFLEFARKGERIFRKLSEIPKITIAALKGYVLGGGFELALACDIRVATEDVKMGFPEVTLGLIPAWGGSQRLAKLAGMSKALQLILTGERITGREAATMGLVAKIFKEDIDTQAVEYAKNIALNSAPVAAMLAKRLINKGAEAPMDVGLEMEAFAAGLVYNTEDLKEGLSAFLQKRKPKFKGK